MIANQNLSTEQMFGGLGADYLTFEGFMVDFRKKISWRLISKGKKAFKEIPGKNNVLH